MQVLWPITGAAYTPVRFIHRFQKKLHQFGRVRLIPRAAYTPGITVIANH